MQRTELRTRASRGASMFLAFFTLLMVTIGTAVPTRAAMQPAQSEVAATDPSTVYAYIVGISTYLNGKDSTYQERYSLPNLKFPADDAAAFRDMLLQAGVPKANIRIRVNEQATEQELHDGFSWLVSQDAHAGLLCFYYSGHGEGLIPDTDGDEALRNPDDHFDEGLIPYDYIDLYQYTPKQIAANPELRTERDQKRFIDDELFSYVSQIKSSCLLVLDSCFSGGAVRDLPTDKIADIDKEMFVEKRIRFPFNVSPADMDEAIASSLGEYAKYVKLEDNLPRPPSGANAGESLLDLPPNIAFLAACQETQVAHEYGSNPPSYNINGGVFTHYLVQAELDPDTRIIADVDKDGNVDLYEAFDFAYSKVGEFAKALMTKYPQRDFSQDPSIANDDLIKAIRFEQLK